MSTPPSKQTTAKRKPAAHKLPSSRGLQAHYGIDDQTLRIQKVNEIASLLWVPERASQKDRLERTVRALELYESLAPVDGAEGMLAMQMVATHDAALQCLKRAAASPQEFKIVDLSLKQAHKLMTLYTQQLATLNKHRGKGQQKVTVEHVNVQAGGQAIVGTVEAGASQRGGATEPEVFEHRSEMPLDVSVSKTQQPADKR